MYHIRYRFGVPFIASLLLAMLAAYPVEALIVSPAAARSPFSGLLHALLRIALFVWFFAPTQHAWHCWLAQRPPLLVLRGDRSRSDQDSLRASR